MFKLLASYSQKQNRLAKRKDQKLMKLVRNTILKKTILNNIWYEIFFAIIYDSNLLLTLLLNRLSLYKVLTRLLHQLNHL